MSGLEVVVGRLTAFVGVSASGKTRAALQGCEDVLRKGEPVLYIDADANLGLGAAQAALGRAERFWLAQPNSPAQAMEQALAFCRGRVGGLLVIDSLDGLEPLPRMRRRLMRLWLPRLVGAAYAGSVRVLMLAHPPAPNRSDIWPTYCFNLFYMHSFRS